MLIILAIALCIISVKISHDRYMGVKWAAKQRKMEKKNIVNLEDYYHGI